MNNSRYATTHNNPPSPLTSHAPNAEPSSNSDAASTTKIFHDSVALADLGSARFNHDTAQITDRDASLHTGVPTTLRKGRAPKGLENQAFAWSTFQYTTSERDEREEKKGELHEGMLHRLNREARGEDGGGVRENAGVRGGRGGRGRGGRWGRMAGEVAKDDGREDALCAGRKLGENVPPLAKGLAEEMDKSMFWDGPIV